MRIYLRLILFPLIFAVSIYGFVYSRNEIFCPDQGGDLGLRIQAERYLNMERKLLLDKPPFGDVKCEYTSEDVVKNMTDSTGRYYVYCNRYTDGEYLDNVVFVLSRCFFVKDEVYLDMGS